jgi:small subunit ribosomal protein S16
MATKIRLLRRGRKKYARYDVVVADTRAPRDGKFIEKIGLFNPNAHPAVLDINTDRAFYWIMKGAQPTDTARNLLAGEGLMLKKHLQIGVNKGAITQDQADKKFSEWKDEKENKNQKSATTLQEKKSAEAKARLAAETKVNEARKAAIAAKQKPAEEPKAEVEAESTPAVEAPVAEAPAETPAAEGGEDKAAE